MSDEKTPSVPPDLSTTQRAAIVERKIELAARSEWFIAGLLFVLIITGRAPIEPWLYWMIALGAPSAFANLLHILGFKAKPTGSFVHLLALGVGKVGVGGVLKKLIIGAVALFTVGCGGTIYDETLARLNKTADTVSKSQPKVLLLCQADPGQRCDDARQTYEAAGAAVAAAHDALEVYRVTGEGLDAVADAVRKAVESAREVGRVVAQ